MMGSNHPAVLHESPRSLKEMAQDCREHVRFASIIRTAAETGWFCNGMLVSHLSKTETEQFAGFLKKCPQLKEEGYVIGMKRLLNVSQASRLRYRCCSPKETDFPYSPSVVELVDKWKDSVYVLTWMFASLLNRHPTALIYRTSDIDNDAPLILIAEKYIVGMVMPFNPFLQWCLPKQF